MTSGLYRKTSLQSHSAKRSGRSQSRELRNSKPIAMQPRGRCPRSGLFSLGLKQSGRLQGPALEEWEQVLLRQKSPPSRAERRYIESMPSWESDPKVVNFFDCADVVRTSATYGQEAGYRWRSGRRYRKVGEPKTRLPESVDWRGGRLVRRTVEAVRGDVMHVRQRPIGLRSWTLSSGYGTDD